MTAHYSWPQFKAPLQLDVLSVRFDGEEADVAYSAVRRVHLDEVDVSWQEFEIELELSTAESTPQDLQRRLMSAHAVLSSPATNTRLPVRLQEVDGGWRGTGTVARSEVGGVMTLEAFVTAEDDASRPLIRGTSDEWAVVVERGQSPAAPTQIPVVSTWIDFDAPDAPTLCRMYKSAPFAVVLEGAKPVLYLNSLDKGFQKLMLSEHAQLERRRHRDTMSSIVAAAVTRALLQAAFDELIQNSETSDVPMPSDEPLFRQTCTAVAAEMQSVSDVDDLYSRMFDASKTSMSQIRDLWAELDLAIGELVNLNDTMVKVAEEVR